MSLFHLKKKEISYILILFMEKNVEKKIFSLTDFLNSFGDVN